MGEKNVSMRTIARECGVSINTVSHALRDFPDISKATKQRICQKAIELGYMPNVVSQQLKNEEKPIIALLTGSLSDLYFSILCDEIIKIVREKDEYSVQILSYADDDMSILKQCVLQRVDMIVTHDLFSSEAMEFAELNNIKIITVGGGNLEVNADVVSVNEKMSCEQVARYLWGIHKGKKFIYVGLDYFVSDLRYKYFKKALNELNETDIVYFDAEKEDEQVLLDYILNGYRSIFFFDDSLVYRMLAKLDKIVVNVRKAFPDLHLVGFDGLCENIEGMQQISTVKIDYPAFAEAIYQMISFRFNNPKAGYKRTLLPTKLHQRTKS